MTKLNQKCTVIEQTVNAVLGLQKAKYKGVKLILVESDPRPEMEKMLNFIDVECKRVGLNPFVIHRVLFSIRSKKELKIR
jgi:hypothetical protein